ncbi:L-type lectin-domain containing receptor kinase IV.2 [Linum perenne]
MSPKLTFLILAASIFATSAASSNDLSFTYNHFPTANLILDGVAEFTSDHLLRLTNDTLQQEGHAFYPDPVTFKNISNGSVSSFSTCFVFAVVPQYSNLGSPGMAFVISPARGLPGSLPSQYLGLFNKSNLGNVTNRVFAVELDTIRNSEFGDINDNHVGIDVNGLDSRAAAPAGYYDSEGKFVDLTLISGQPIPFDLPHQKLPRIGEEQKKRSLLLTVVLVASSVISLSLTLVSGIVYFVKRHRKFAQVLEDWEQDYGPHRFNFKDLYIATKGFHAKEVLGRGGFGMVFKGVMPKSKIEVAVKRISHHNSTEGVRGFVAEIVSMGRLRHRNLVSLLGYCRRKGELFLVYDYMSNRSLDMYIHGQPRSPLEWCVRFKVMKGVASGLFYLHEGWEQVVIHRDVKASNVMVDSEWNGRLGDFGLARLYNHGSNPQTTSAIGTWGFVAPEYARTGKATTSSDVYAFGAFLLEVACGRQPMDSTKPLGEVMLVDWVFSCWTNGQILEAVDHNLGDVFVREQVELVLKLGLLCSHSDPEARPSMRQVYQMLEGEMPLPDMSNKPFMGLSMSSIGLKYSRLDSLHELDASSPSSCGSFNHLSSAEDSLISGGR